MHTIMTAAHYYETGGVDQDAMGSKFKYMKH